MGRYRRTSQRKLFFTENNMKEIKNKLKAGYSKRYIANELKINESTLRKRLKCGNVPISLGRYQTDIPKNLEIELAQRIRELDQMFYGITKKDLQIVAFKFAEANNLKHRFNREKKLAGNSWVYGFCERNQIVLRQPEKHSMARLMGFNRSQVEIFYDNLEYLYQQRQYSQTSIYNMDETGLSTVPNHPPKILTSIGKKYVGKISSSERGQLTTAICCMSAAGDYVPPGLIFRRKRFKNELFNDAPVNTLKMISDSGYINKDLFHQWLIHFKQYAKPSAEEPKLLILDNHTSHRDVEAIKFAKENYIDILSLPPHSSHRLQPLDVGFFGPLKKSYSYACDQWMIGNPGKIISQMQISKLFNKAYISTANIQKAQVSFMATGIFPFNRQKFTTNDFVPSLFSSINDHEDFDLNINISNVLPLPKINQQSDQRKSKQQKSEILSLNSLKSPSTSNTISCGNNISIYDHSALSEMSICDEPEIVSFMDIDQDILDSIITSDENLSDLIKDCFVKLIDCQNQNNTIPYKNNFPLSDEHVLDNTSNSDGYHSDLIKDCFVKLIDCQNQNNTIPYKNNFPLSDPQVLDNTSNSVGNQSDLIKDCFVKLIDCQHK